MVPALLVRELRVAPREPLWGQRQPMVRWHNNGLKQQRDGSVARRGGARPCHLRNDEVDRILHAVERAREVRDTWKEGDHSRSHCLVLLVGYGGQSLGDDSLPQFGLGRGHR